MDGNASPVVTLVLRLWRAGQRGFHFQTTHIQTGDIAYFRTIDAVTSYVEGLAAQLVAHNAPLQFPVPKGSDRDVQR